LNLALWLKVNQPLSMPFGTRNSTTTTHEYHVPQHNTNLQARRKLHKHNPQFQPTLQLHNNLDPQRATATNKQWLSATGFPPHPGPPHDTNNDTYTIQSINVTNAQTHLTTLLESTADHIQIQERSLDKAKAATFTKDCRTHNQQATLSPLDPNTKQHTGGVATLSKNHNFTLIPQTTAYANALRTGRLAQNALPLTTATYIIAHNLYGWSSRHLRGTPLHNHHKTDNLLHIILNEYQQTTTQLHLLTGDFNAQPHELPNFQRLLDAG
jgi:hypothetical protein